MRARDGNGDGSRFIDIGAFELQAPPPPAMPDFGDAPDSGVGTGPGNYNTTASDNGPSHIIVPGLRIGANVDADSGSLQNGAADDVNGALPDDEDGVVNPAADLVLTVGAQPTVNVRVTNAIGAAATLYGWIDYNADGVFDNVTERANVAVPSGTNNGIVTLVFPPVPNGFTGTTYARFRLSTDTATANPMGAAANGEVEDHHVTIVQPNVGSADASKTKRIVSDGVGEVRFGGAIASIGDLDGDGVTDMAVGASGEAAAGMENQGAVYVLFMNRDGTVRSSQKIGDNTGGGPPLPSRSSFGRSVAALGDLDGDGVTELAVGLYLEPHIQNSGGVNVLFMNANGTVKSRQLIGDSIGGGPNLEPGSNAFGSSITSIGDLDGDGIGDMAVGDRRGNTNRGAVHILFMNANGTAKSSRIIIDDPNPDPPNSIDWEAFGSGVASLGDLDGDGVTELAVGAAGDDADVVAEGAVFVCFLNPDGTVKRKQKIGSSIGGGPALNEVDQFGTSVAAIGDIDGDGLADLAVGAIFDDTRGLDRGAVYVLRLNADGTAKSFRKIADGTGGGPTLENRHTFGRAIASLGDLDGDGLTDLAVGSEVTTFGTDPGSIHVLFLKPIKDYIASATQKIASGTGGGPPLVNGDMFGASVAPLGDLDGDGVEDMAVGAPSQTGAASAGAVQVLFMNPNGTVKASQPIGSGIGGGPVLAHGDYFGHSVAAIGDLNGDGIADLAVGASKDDTGGYISGAVYVLFLNANGTAKGSQKIASGIGGAPGLATGDRFGSAVASLGDLDGDGIRELAVGAASDDTGGSYRGAVHVLFMCANGTAKASQKIASGVGGGPVLANGDVFGGGLASLGDLDGDHVSDLAVGAMFDDTHGPGRGAVHILFLNQNATVKASQKIASGVGGVPPLNDGDYFGRSVALLGDLDGDGLSDLAVGAYRDDTGGADRGALHVLLLNANGTVKRNSKIASSSGSGPTLANDDHFGTPWRR